MKVTITVTVSPAGRPLKKEAMALTLSRGAGTVVADYAVPDSVVVVSGQQP